jgi:hypothetical protein
MSAPFATYKFSKLVVPTDGAVQPTYTRIVCVTAGNLVFRTLDPVTGVESADITIAMTPMQTLDVMPTQIRATGLTGTYLGQIAG